MSIRVTRLPHNPIVRPEMDARMGSNINGPSLIKVPCWVERPMGRYYLYFAHHLGTYIRLAYADELEGPWRIHEPGALDLTSSHFPVEAEPYGHIASPDVHVLDDEREIRMYYHGQLAGGPQRTRVAQSPDGLGFKAREEVLAHPYYRGFRHEDWHYGIAMPGIFYRSEDGLTGFEQGPQLFEPSMRHAAVMKRETTLFVFWTRVGDVPEHILLSRVDLRPDWTEWTATPPEDILLPETDWEGAREPLVPSRRGAIMEPVNQLRDPCIFEEDDNVWLLYSVAGESGIAIAKVADAR
ncbi:MAG: hypothetical protein P8Y95_00045 [Gammaproteobacteria bacterium]